MTDTTKPPNRPTSSRPRPFGRDGQPPARGADKLRGGDKPRTRSTGDRDAPARRDSTTKTRGTEPAPAKDDARIAKVMARAGLCSRRDAESWIAAGRVAVNGTVIDSPALNVAAEDRITVDGELLPEREQTRLFLFHKPRGLVTTARDPEGRPTIFDNLPPGLPRVVSVGRLDINTEGLMLLTNDGGLARVLELPATGWLRRYRVRANGTIDQARLDALKAGVTIDGIDYAGIEATLDRVQGANVWLTMGLREGKNREIKRVLESLGLAVTRLIRISFGPFQLGELADGAVEAVPTRVLRDQLGPTLAADAGVDLETRDEPVPRRAMRLPEGVAPARPSRTVAAAPRPHVSALRAARGEEAGESRKRIERGATADRKGRAVKVERVIPVGPGAERTGESRNARRFAAEKTDYVGGRQKTRAEAGPFTRGAGAPARPRRTGEDTQMTLGGFGAKPRTARGTRGGDDAPVERTAARPRVTRAADAAAPSRTSPRGGFGDKPRTGRPTRVEDDATGERTTARPRSTRTADASAPSRAPPRGGYGDKARGERFEASAGVPAGKPRSPRSGKPNGRPGGFSSERPATGRNKPPGARPSGPRPTTGGRPTGGDRPKGGGRPPRARP